MITKISRSLYLVLVLSVFPCGADASFIGPIPVQFVTAGEKTTINLRRFCEPDTSDHVIVVPSSDYRAELNRSTLELVFEVAPEHSGLVEMPIVLQTAQGEKMGVMTLAVGTRHKHVFRYKPETKPARAVVAGSFNGWSQDRTVLEDPDGDGTYEATTLLDPGTYTYKFVVDGKWIADPGNPDKIDDGFQGFNSVIKVEGATGGSAPAIYAEGMENWGWTIRVVAGSDPVKDVSAVIERADGTSAALDPGSVARVEGGAALKVMRAGLPVDAWVRVVVADEKGRVSNTVRFRTAPPKTFDWNDAIVYFAFTDRFRDGDTTNDMPVADPEVLPPANWHGGDWAGVREMIRNGYFDSIGVNVVWLSPLNRNPSFAEADYDPPHRKFSGYHGYWPVSSTEVEPHFGDAAMLKALVSDAHAHGIKVIADLVMNHVHDSHPFVKAHPDWFGSLYLPDGSMNMRMWDAHPYTTWFTPFLPDLNYDNEELVATMFANAEWWAREYDLDGFRLDAVKHVPPDIWRRFSVHMRNTIGKERGSFYLVGETFRDRQGIMSFVGPNGLDGQFDFPLYDTLKSIFAQGNSGFGELDASLSASERIYGKESLMAPLVGNHDKSRFMAFADGELPDPAQSNEQEVGWTNPPIVRDPANYAKLKMALTFLLSIDGVPTVYYGDEIGMTGAGDPDNRRDMRFGDDVSRYERSVLQYFSAMTKIRREHSALRYGSRRALLIEDNRYAYVRAFFEDRVLVAFNRATTPTDLVLNVAPEFSDGDYIDLLTGRDLKVEGGKITVPMRGRSAAIVAKKIGEQFVFRPVAEPEPVKTAAASASPAFKTVGIAGTINNWNTADKTMKLSPRPDGAWELTRMFERGNYNFKFVMNEGWDVHRGLKDQNRLEQPGRDIPLEVPASGFYTVRLEPGADAWSFAPAAPPMAVADAAVAPSYPLGLPLVLDAAPSRAGPGRTIRSYTWTQLEGDAYKLKELPLSGGENVRRVSLLPEHPGVYRIRLTVDDAAAAGSETGMPRDLKLVVKESWQLKTAHGQVMTMDAGPDASSLHRYYLSVAKTPVVFHLQKNFKPALFGPRTPLTSDLRTTAKAEIAAGGKPITIKAMRPGLAEISFDPRTNMVTVRRSEVTRFAFNPARANLPAGTDVVSVAIAGSFNGWSSTKDVMTKRSAGVWEIYADLPAGKHQYKLVVNNKHWIADPNADPKLATDDGYGGTNSGIIIGVRGDDFGPAAPESIVAGAVWHDPNERDYFNVFAKDAADVRIRVRENDVPRVFVRLRGGSTKAGDRIEMQKLFSRLGFDYFGAYVPLSPGAKSLEYDFVLEDSPCVRYFAAASTLQKKLTPRDKPFVGEIRPTFLTPDWAKNVVWYQIMLDRWRDDDPANDPDSSVPWRWDWFKPFAPGETPNFYGPHGIWQRFYGGDLKGLIDKLDYLEDLGVTGIYLNPMFEASSHHKYNTTDYRHIDDNFGAKGDVFEAEQSETSDSRTWRFTPTDTLFVTFLAEAHKRGFKVIIDGVFNHSGTDFWAFQDIVRNGKNSPYKDWYVIKDWNVPPPYPGGPTFSYEGWAGFSGLPEYAEDEHGLLPGIRNHIFDITRRWMDPNGDGDPSDGVDGWRLDVPENINEAFWRDWRKVVKGVNPDAYIVGEIWDNAANRLQGDHHDAVMNYEFVKRVYGFFLPGGTTPPMTPSAFAKSLAELEGWYLPQVNMVLQNLLSSHDVDRIASAIHNHAGWKRGRLQDENPSYDTGPPTDADYEILKQIFTFQMMWLGAPMIYYGDEAGMYGADDPSNRMPMWWKDLMPYDNPAYRIRDDLREHVRRLIAIRNTYSCLRTGRTRTLVASDAAGIFAFERSDFQNSAIVVVNNGADEVITGVPARDGARYVNVVDPATSLYFRGIVQGIGSVRELVRVKSSAATIEPDHGKLRVTVPAHGALVLVER